MVHSEVYLNKYVVSIKPFSTPACPDCSQNIQKTAFLACFRFLIFHPFFQGVQLALFADTHDSMKVRYDTRCYFNVRSKADKSHLIYRTEPATKKWKTEKNWKLKKRICSEVSVNSPGIRGVSPEEENEGYGGNDLQKRKVLSREWKSEGVMDDGVDGTAAGGSATQRTGWVRIGEISAWLTAAALCFRHVRLSVCVRAYRSIL